MLEIKPDVVLADTKHLALDVHPESNSVSRSFQPLFNIGVSHRVKNLVPIRPVILGFGHASNTLLASYLALQRLNRDRTFSRVNKVAVAVSCDDDSLLVWEVRC